MSKTPLRDESTSPIPNERIRGLAVMFLRMGFGMALLCNGVAGYIGQGVGTRGGIMTGFGPAPLVNTVSGPIAEMFRVVPYFLIAIGVALLLGFLTTIMSLIALTLEIAVPAFEIVIGLMTHTQGVFLGQLVLHESLTSASRLLTVLFGVLVLLCSPRELNPYSLDAIVFGPEPLDEAPDGGEGPPMHQAASSRLVGRPIDDYLRPGEPTGDSKLD